MILVFYSLLLSFAIPGSGLDWGFYAHRKINRMAVFTLAPDLFKFYKKHIDHIENHAVDPDKRRYALKNEFSRHYMDLDHWDSYPFQDIPKDYWEACMAFGHLICTNAKDTSYIKIDRSRCQEFYDKCIYGSRYDPIVDLNADLLADFIEGDIDQSEEAKYQFQNKLVEYGILPYFLEYFYNRLVHAFRIKDLSLILGLSSDIGHYIADAHVPLHTTENYNGQLTGQTGIHSFWESRLPELFAEENYDFVVGRAIYCDNIQEMIWEILKVSHDHVNMILAVERKLSEEFPEDLQFNYEYRSQNLKHVTSAEYAGKFHVVLGGMVQKRMQDAVLAVGTLWYSAWLDAGQPDLSSLKKVKDSVDEAGQNVELEAAFGKGAIYGRKH